MQMMAASAPLSRHVLFQSGNLDEARERVARVFCPHLLETIGRGARLNARHHHVAGERLSLNYITYGAQTLIAPGELERFYLIQIPLTGGASITNGHDRYQSSPKAAAVLNPHLPTTMVWEEGTRQILVQIDRKALETHLSDQIRAPLGQPLTFDGPLDLTRGTGARLYRLVMHLVEETDADRIPIGTGLMARQVESALLSGLLEAHRHNYAGLLGRGHSAPLPRVVRLAEAFIEANLDSALTIEDIASAVGVSPRGLQIAFRQHRDTTPLTHWRDRRLMRAHADLIAGDPDTSVTAVALSWGFAHFGRFSESYREKFGLSPSETLRAAQKSASRR